MRFFLIKGSFWAAAWQKHLPGGRVQLMSPAEESPILTPHNNQQLEFLSERKIQVFLFEKPSPRQ